MFRHVHIRKRLSRALEPYPSKHTWKRLLDTTVYVAGTIGPLMTIPQVVLIYSTKNATGVSPTSWIAWALLDIPWIMYGFMHREPPIVITYSLWLFFNLLVFIGAIIY